MSDNIQRNHSNPVAGDGAIAAPKGRSPDNVKSSKGQEPQSQYVFKILHSLASLLKTMNFLSNFTIFCENSRVSVDLGELNLASSETSSESGASEEAVEMPTPEGLTNSMKIFMKNVQMHVFSVKF